MADPFDYEKDVPEDVKDKLERLLGEELQLFYTAAPKPKMRGYWFRHKHCRDSAPPIVKKMFELLAKISEEEEKKGSGSSGSSKPSSAKPAGKPKPSKTAAEELAEALAAAVGGSEPEPEPEEVETETIGANPFGEAEITDELKKLPTLTGTAAGTIAKTAIDKMETTNNRICACPRCLKGR